MEKLNVSLWFSIENFGLIMKVRRAFTQDELSTKVIHDALHSIHELEKLISDEE